MLQKEKQSKKVLRNVLLAFVLMLVVTVGVKLDAKAAGAKDTLSFGKDCSISAKVLGDYKWIRLNGHNVTITDDLITKADIYLDEGTLEVKGKMVVSGKVYAGKGKLIVNKDFIMDSNGVLDLGDVGSKITFKQNVTFQNGSQIKSTCSDVVKTGAPKVEVEGKFNYKSKLPSDVHGTEWSVLGDFIQSGSGNLQIGRLILKGTAQQMLSLKKESALLYLKANNQNILMDGYLNGTKFESNFAPKMNGALYSNSKINFNGKHVILCNGFVAEDLVTLGTGCILSVGKSMQANGVIDCSGATLKVVGSYTQSDKYLFGSSSTTNFFVGGDLIFNNKGSICFDSNSNVRVSGNLVYASTANSNDNRCVFHVGGKYIKSGTGKLAGKVVIEGDPDKMDVTDIFVDVNVGDWFVNAVQYVYDTGLMFGETAITFGPDNTLTRGQMVTIIYRLAGSPKVKFKTAFTDVKENDFFAYAVVWATNKGIVAGMNSAEFAPSAPITREMLATMLYRYAKLKNYKLDNKADALNKFNDKSQVSDWASEAMKWAITNGVMNGKSERILAPKEEATRAQCAQMIINFNNNIIK